MTWRPSFLAPTLLLALAIVGPDFTGPAAPPAFAPSAAQLLPPGARVQEASIEGGGYVRALEVEALETGIRVRSHGGWRTLHGIVCAAPVRDVRLWLGSDHQGRSILARTIHGARTSVLVAAIATLLAVLLGTLVGLASGFLPGIGQALLKTGTDGLLGMPRLLLLLILGVALRGAPAGVALAIGLASWMEVSRLVEAEARTLRGLEFVAAARASGIGGFRLAWNHLLPNLGPILGVAAPLVATDAILLESTLSFLGVAGGQASSSWGGIVADGQRFLPDGWWMVVFPGLLLCATALAVHGLARPPAERSGG